MSMGIFNFKGKKEPALPSVVPKKKPIIRNAFQAATQSRLTNNWYHPLLSASKEMQYDYKRLKQVSRYLSNNDVYTSRYLDLIQTHIVGPQGIQLQPRLTDPNGEMNVMANTEILDNWNEWCKNCSYDGKLSFVEIEQLIIRSVAMDGEMFIRFVKGPTVNEFGFALLPIESDLLDIDYNQYASPDGTVIIQGVEQDQKTGAPIAYWFWSRNPNDSAIALPLKRIRVPAEEVIHIYKIKRAGQVRGLPWITPAMFSLAKLHEYLDAEIVAAQAAASTFATIETPSSDSSQFIAPEGYANEQLNVEIGSAIRLAPGESLKAFTSTHPTNAFESFVKAMLQGISSALNVPYASLSGDTSQESYASGRIQVIEARDMYRNLQTWFTRIFHERVYKMWIDTVMERGLIDLPSLTIDEVDDVIFRPRGWAWADPKKDADGVQTLIDLNMKSKTQLCAEQGVDFADVLRDRFEEKKAEADMERRLAEFNKLPIDPTEVVGEDIVSTDLGDVDTDTEMENMTGVEDPMMVDSTDTNENKND
jgi:lambda family phage portal protein